MHLCFVRVCVYFIDRKIADPIFTKFSTQVRLTFEHVRGQNDFDSYPQKKFFRRQKKNVC